MNEVESMDNAPARGPCQFLVLSHADALEPLLHRLLATRRWRTALIDARPPTLKLGQAVTWIDLRAGTPRGDWFASLRSAELVCVAPRAGDEALEVVAVLAPTAAQVPVADVESLSRIDARQGAPRTERLSQRELDVLNLLAQGHSNREISARLHVTLGTVKGYVSQILAKMGVRDRTQAALCIAYGNRQTARDGLSPIGVSAPRSQAYARTPELA